MPGRDVMSWHGCANMCRMNDAERAEAGRKAVRAYRRSKTALDRDRAALRTFILTSAADGKGPAEITRLIDHEYDVAHVSRIIHGKA